jgi:murein tripeptide amidase MpaA
MSWQFEVGVDFWTTGGAGRTSRVMVSPEAEKLFVNFLKSTDIEHTLTVSDVESTLAADKAARMMSRLKRKADSGPNFEVFWSFEEMEAFTLQLAQNYPNLVKRDIIGKSSEGRDIFALRVSNSAEFGKKPIIFIDSGIHAREWVGHQSTLFLLNELVTNEVVTRELVDNADWVIVPNVNPDGYVYSWTTDRLWRKNRRYINETCTGVDLNRNFGYMWRYRPNSVSLLMKF